MNLDMIELVNERQDSCWISPVAWMYLIRLADQYGWQARGTVLLHSTTGEPRAVWDGSYVLTAGQIAMAEDVSSMADALERALPDITDEDVAPPLTEENKPQWFRFDPLAMLSGPRKMDVQMMINFFREGSLIIQ